MTERYWRLHDWLDGPLAVTGLWIHICWVIVAFLLAFGVIEKPASADASPTHGQCSEANLADYLVGDVRGDANEITYTTDAPYIYGVCIGTARFETSMIAYNGYAYTPLLNPRHPGNWGCYRVQGVGYVWQTDGWHWMDGEQVPGHFEPQQTVTVTRTSTECAPLNHIDIVVGD